jgi:hypothetical protein
MGPGICAPIVEATAMAPAVDEPSGDMPHNQAPEAMPRGAVQVKVSLRPHSGCPQEALREGGKGLVSPPKAINRIAHPAWEHRRRA